MPITLKSHAGARREFHDSMERISRRQRNQQGQNQEDVHVSVAFMFIEIIRAYRLDHPIDQHQSKRLHGKADHDSGQDEGLRQGSARAARVSRVTPATIGGRAQGQAGNGENQQVRRVLPQQTECRSSA